MEGHSLKTILERENVLPLDLAINVTIQTCDALDFAWRKRRLMHLDLSLRKVLLSTDDSVKIVDIGLAPLRLAQSGNIQNPSEEALLGSPEFLAPEIILGKSTDHRTDLYSVGILLFRMLAGRFPFEGDDPLAVASKHLSEEPISIRSVNPDIPVRVSAIVEKLLAKYPDDRFPSGMEVIARLRDCLRRYAPRTAPESDAETADREQWKCPLCGDWNSADDRFCSSCGTEGVETCPVCSAEVRISAPFCPKCGTNVAAKKRDLQRTTETLLQRFRDAVEKDNLQQAVDPARLIAEINAENLDNASEEIYQQLLGTFRDSLEKRMESATRTHDLEEYQTAVRCLSDLFGAKAYAWHNTQLQKAKSELASKISLAGAAMTSNCLYQARRLLDETPPWTGGELGSRREELVEQCGRLIEERDRACKRSTTMLDQFDERNAVRFLGELSRFLLSDKLTVVSPDPEDTEADKKIRELIDKIGGKLEAAVRRWIGDNDWSKVLRLLEECREVGGQANEKIEQTIREMAKSEVRERYKKAIRFEEKDAFSSAADAWRFLLDIPAELLPPRARLYAADSPNRRLRQARAIRRKLINGHLTLFFFLWCFALSFPAAKLIQSFLAGELKTTGILAAAIPVLAQMLLFFLFWMLATSPNRLDDMDLIPHRQGSLFAVLLGAAWTLSPLVFVIFAMHRALLERLQPEGIWQAAWIPAAIVLCLWILADLIRARSFRRLPALFGLTLSWGAAWLMMTRLPQALAAPQALPSTLSGLHCGIYLLLQALHYAIYRFLGRRAQPRKRNSVEDSGT